MYRSDPLLLFNFLVRSTSAACCRAASARDAASAAAASRSRASMRAAMRAFRWASAEGCGVVAAVDSLRIVGVIALLLRRGGSRALDRTIMPLDGGIIVKRGRRDGVRDRRRGRGSEVRSSWRIHQEVKLGLHDEDILHEHHPYNHRPSYLRTSTLSHVRSWHTQRVRYAEP